MIPRTLIPRDARPLARTPAESPPRRLTTMLDDRTLVAANLPHLELDLRTSIPVHLPLEVLAARVVVPRDTPAAPLSPEVLHPDYAPATPLDQRVTVPVALPVVELAPRIPVSIHDLPDVLDPDVVTTGEVNLMIEPVKNQGLDWNWVSRAASIAVHAAFIVFLLLLPKIFPNHQSSQDDIARQQLSYLYLPPGAGKVSPSPPEKSPRVRIDPRVLRRLVPSPSPSGKFRPIPQPKAPERVAPKPPVQPPPDLPAAPQPRIQTARKEPDFLRQPLQAKPDIQHPAKSPNQKLILPQMSSPGRSLEESARQAIQGGGGTEQFGGPMPGGGPNPGGQGGGGGGGYAGAGIQMLTPTEGVDFSSYLARVLASVKRNWYAVMPESARLGDQGRVVLQFRIMRNGGVPSPEPQLMSSSGKEPLDRAAISSIRTSSPFEPLPSAFSGPYIELRFIFLYNLPLNYGQ